MVAEENSVSVKDQSIACVARNFLVNCPVCGSFNHQTFGHHGTLSKKELAAIFPKSERKAIKAGMSPKEQSQFNRSMEGKRMPNDEEICRWKSIRGKPPES